MPISVEVIMQHHKEMLIELANGINVREQHIDLLRGYNFRIKEFHLKVTYNQTQVMNILLFSHH